MLVLSREILSQIRLHGESSYPNEGCGLLLGSTNDGQTTAKSIFPVANSWENEEEKSYRFRISEADMLAAELRAVEMDLDVIGIFHSHPDHPPVASPRDLAWASWSGYSYLITEILKGKAVGSRSWQLKEDRQGFYEEPVSIID